MSTYSTIFISILILSSIIYVLYTKSKSKNQETLKQPKPPKHNETQVEKKQKNNTTRPVAVKEPSKEEIKVEKTKEPEISTPKVEAPVKEVPQEKVKEEVPAKRDTEKEQNDLPTMGNSKFDHARLIEMGLADDEAQEFVQDLISQVQTHIPLLKSALNEQDFVKLEELTHSIKGSATNIGVGGIADLLVDFNTYLKGGKDIAVVQRYLMFLRFQLKALEKQYS